VKNRDYSDYIQDILSSILEGLEFVKGLSYEDFQEDKKTLYAVIRTIEVMGEAAKNLPISIQKKYPEIPWKEIRGMRNKLIHEYFGVDTGVIWKTVQEDFPLLKKQIKKVQKAFKDS
jgi:uncharacterized protein with HEPN domain